MLAEGVGEVGELEVEGLVDGGALVACAGPRSVACLELVRDVEC